MKQADLNRAVAHITGESVATIQRLGFLLAEPEQDFIDEQQQAAEAGPHVIDWDELEQRHWYRQFHQEVDESFDEKELFCSGVGDAALPA